MSKIHTGDSPGTIRFRDELKGIVQRKIKIHSLSPHHHADGRGGEVLELDTCMTPHEQYEGMLYSFFRLFYYVWWSSHCWVQLPNPRLQQSLPLKLEWTLWTLPLIDLCVAANSIRTLSCYWNDTFYRKFKRRYNWPLTWTSNISRPCRCRRAEG